MDLNLSNESKIIEVCVHLHNFIIKEDVPDGENVETYVEKTGMSIEPMESSDSNIGYYPFLDEIYPDDGTSPTRDMIVRYISKQGYRHPIQNIKHKLNS